MRDRGRPRRSRRAASTGCSQARDARANLPSRVNQPSELAEVRIPIPDRPGAAAEIFTLAAELGVNIASFEVVHSVEGNKGVAVVLVDAAERRPVPRRPHRPRLPPGRAAAELMATVARAHRSPGRSTRWSRCPVRRASPTARWCAPRSPTASRCCAACPTATTVGAMLDCLAVLGVAVGAPGRRAGDDRRRRPWSRRAGASARLTLPARLAGTTSRFVTALAALAPGRAHRRRAPAAARPPDGAAARRARCARCRRRPR